MAWPHQAGRALLRHGAGTGLCSHFLRRGRGKYQGKYEYLPGPQPHSPVQDRRTSGFQKPFSLLRFYENPGEHNAPRHDGLRTDRYTLSYIWTSDEWMLFDNQKDPAQMHNVINKPEYAETVKELKTLYGKLRKDYQVPEGFPGPPANWPSSRSGTALPPEIDAAIHRSSRNRLSGTRH